MKATTSAAILIAFVAIALVGAGPASTRSDDEAMIHQLEDQLAVAYGHNDADALDRMWAPDYTFVNPAGVMLTRAQRLALFKTAGTKVESYTRDDETIRVYGSTAVVTFRSTVAGTSMGARMDGQRRAINVLVKNDGRWQVVAQQTTAIMDQAAGAAQPAGASHRITVSPSAIAGLPRTSVRTHLHGTTEEATYEGIALGDLLRKNGAPAGEAIRGTQLSLVVVVKASDGYQAIFALPELDPAFTKKVVLLADKRNGEPLSDKEGPFRLVIPDEARAARSVRQVVSVELRDFK